MDKKYTYLINSPLLDIFMNKWFTYLLINLGIFLLEFAFIDFEVKRNQPGNNMAGIAYIFIPWIHAFLTGILALALLYFRRKDYAKLFGYTSLVILVIGFSVCGGMFVLSR